MNSSSLRFILLRRLLYLLSISFLFSCSETDKQATVSTIKLGKIADSLIQAESAKNKKIDSLSKKFVLAENDSSKLNLLLKIGKQINYKFSDPIYTEIQSYARLLKMDELFIQASLGKEFNFTNKTNFDSSQYYHQFISEWAHKNDRKDLIVVELLNYALALEMQKRLKESDSLILKTIELFDEYKLKDKRQKALAFYYIGKNKNEEFDNESSLNYLKQAIKYGEGSGNNDLLADVYFRIGECYLMEADYNNSLVAYGNSIAYAKKCNDERTMSSAFAAIGEIYVNKNDLKKAFDNLFLSLELARKTNYQYQEGYTASSLASAFESDSNYTEAIKYYKESSRVYSSFNKTRHEGEILLNDLNIGSVYTSMKNLDSALFYLESVYKKVNENTDPTISSEVMNNLSDVYYLKGNSNKAEELAQKALSISKQSEITNGIAHSYDVLYRVYEKRKNFEKAHSFYKAFMKLNDSLTNKTQIKRFADLENEMRENQLKTEHDIKETRLKNEKLQK